MRHTWIKTNRGISKQAPDTVSQSVNGLLRSIKEAHLRAGKRGKVLPGRKKVIKVALKCLAKGKPVKKSQRCGFRGFHVHARGMAFGPMSKADRGKAMRKAWLDAPPEVREEKTREARVLMAQKRIAESVEESKRALHKTRTPWGAGRLSMGKAWHEQNS